MSKKERFRNAAKDLVKEIKATGKELSLEEVMKITSYYNYMAPKIQVVAKAYIHREKVALLISQLNTGNIPGLTPICSLEDISKQKLSSKLLLQISRLW